MTPIQQKIEEYREWLQEEVRVRKGAINMGAAMMGMGYEDALQKLDTMFPVEHTSEEPVPTLQQKVDMMQGNLTDYPDETDNIYPKH